LQGFSASAQHHSNVRASSSMIYSVRTCLRQRARGRATDRARPYGPWGGPRPRGPLSPI